MPSSTRPSYDPAERWIGITLNSVGYGFIFFGILQIVLNWNIADRSVEYGFRWLLLPIVSFLSGVFVWRVGRFGFRSNRKFVQEAVLQPESSSPLPNEFIVENQAIELPDQSRVFWIGCIAVCLAATFVAWTAMITIQIPWVRSLSGVCGFLFLLCTCRCFWLLRTRFATVIIENEIPTLGRAVRVVYLPSWSERRYALFEMRVRCTGVIGAASNQCQFRTKRFEIWFHSVTAKSCSFHNRTAVPIAFVLPRFCPPTSPLPTPYPKLNEVRWELDILPVEARRSCLSQFEIPVRISKSSEAEIVNDVDHRGGSTIGESLDGLLRDAREDPWIWAERLTRRIVFWSCAVSLLALLCLIAFELRSLSRLTYSRAAIIETKQMDKKTMVQVQFPLPDGGIQTQWINRRELPFVRNGSDVTMYFSREDTTNAATLHSWFQRGWNWPCYPLFGMFIVVAVIGYRVSPPNSNSFFGPTKAL